MCAPREQNPSSLGSNPTFRQPRGGEVQWLCIDSFRKVDIECGAQRQRNVYAHGAQAKKEIRSEEELSCRMNLIEVKI